MRELRWYLSYSYERSILLHTCATTIILGTHLGPLHSISSCLNLYPSQLDLGSDFGITHNLYNPSPTWLPFESLKVTAIRAVFPSHPGVVPSGIAVYPIRNVASRAGLVSPISPSCILSVVSDAAESNHQAASFSHGTLNDTSKVVFPQTITLDVLTYTHVCVEMCR